MKSLMSINNKFMEVSPKNLALMITKSEYTKGIEIYVDINVEEEVNYLDELIYELKRNDLILQIHGNSELPLERQLEYFKKIESYSDYLGYPIVVTLHSLFDEDKDQSLKKTVDYMGNLINKIDNNKIIICLENLNDTPGLDRLEKEYITPIILNDESLYFTYDIGHEIADHGNVTNLNGYMIEEIRNVHIHTSDKKGNDHMPIYENDDNWEDVLKGILFLVNNKYEYNIVYEYNLLECHGKTIEEKINSYLESIDIISKHYGK